MPIVICVLVLATAVSLVKYYFLFKDNIKLRSDIRRLSDKVIVLEKKRTALEEEIIQQTALNEKVTKEKEDLEIKLTKINDDIAKLNFKIASLEGEKAQLNQINTSLGEELQQTRLEKESLEAKFSSLEELEKAIKNLKSKIVKSKTSKPKAVAKKTSKKVPEEKTPEDRSLEEGNLGFMIFGGESTYKSKVKIEVLPAP